MKKNNPKQTAEAKLKRLINETVKKQLREWNDQEEIDAYDADLKDDMKSVSDITGDEVSDNDIDRLNTRNFGIEAGANPTFKRLKDVQMKNDWESYENDDNTEYDETDKDPHAYFDYNFNTFDEPYHRNKFIRNEAKQNIVKKMIREAVNEVSAELADRAAGKALRIGREGFGKYGSYYDGIPNDSYHGKKYNQGQKFIGYRNEKLGSDKGYSICYPDGDGHTIALKDLNGHICTKPCHSIKELETEYKKLQNERMNRTAKLTESDLYKIVKESVNKALNKSNSVFYGDRPSRITKVDRSNSSNKHTMSPDEIEKIRNIVSEASAAPSGFKHRFDPNKRDGDFPLEQPEWTKDPRWQGWNGEDPEWIMKQQEKYPYGGQSKQSVRLSEAELHQIVKENVNKLLKEVQLNELDPRTYASYAAKRQAQGQTNKAKDGEDAAIQAWNKQYGKKDTGTYDNVDDYGDRERKMRNNPYNNKGKYEVTTQYKDRGLGHFSTYRPTMDYNWDSDTEGYETQGKGYRPTQYLGIDDKGTHHYARRDQSQQALQGYEVAKQMANNSGKYIKGKGWQ